MNERTLLVVDLEATCWERQTTPAGEPQAVHNMEIIELGCALATRAGTLLDSRSFLVRPTRFPQLSEFCTTLTSITQSMVDDAPTYPEAIVSAGSRVDGISGPLPCLATYSCVRFDALGI
jgi:inhibitor of KinA sporulation pathway (predicted exonuclease)